MTTRYLRFAALFTALGMTLCGCNLSGASELNAVTPLPSSLPITPAAAEMAAAEMAAPAAATLTPETGAADIPPATATPTPLTRNLPAGSALAIAQATDMALQPTPRQRLTFDESPVKLTFDEFYDGYNVRTGLMLSDKLLSLDGQEVLIEGYMAPPLKAELDWFVLTRIRLAYCPFCSTAADWPDDIALVYLNNDTIRPTEKPLRLHGRLEVGPAVDPETGMVSIVRIYASDLETL